MLNVPENTRCPDEDRYSRLRKVRWMELDRLHQMVPVIIGVGMTGSQVAVQLASLGVKKMILIDHDRLQSSDLGKAYFPEADARASRLKVDVVSKMIRRLNPSIHVKRFPLSFWQFPKGLLVNMQDRGDHLVPIVCVDNRASVIALEAFFMVLGVTCYIGVVTASNLQSQVYVLKPDSGCCACAFTEEDFRFCQVSAGCSGQHGQEEGAPALPSLAAQCSTDLIHEIFWNEMKSLRTQLPAAGRSANGSYKITNSFSPGRQIAELPRSKECPFHYPRVKEMIDVKGNTSLLELQGLVQSDHDQVYFNFIFQHEAFYPSVRCPSCFQPLFWGKLGLGGGICPYCKIHQVQFLPDHETAFVCCQEVHPTLLHMNLDTIGIGQNDIVLAYNTQESILLRKM